MDFSQSLKILGFSKKSFADHIDVTDITVYRWHDSPPKVVVLYLSELSKQNQTFNCRQVVT